MQLAGFDLSEDEMEFQAIRAGGPGGQNVNKVSSAIQLRFDIRRSSLPEPIKSKLATLHDQRVNNEGVIVIKAQRFRSQELNRQDALRRLEDLLFKVSRPVKLRRPTRPGKASIQRRLDKKKSKAKLKSLRGKPNLQD